MLSPSDFNNAVPQFTNGDYASNPINPQYIAEPGAVDYNRGAEPLQTLPAQWWNWFLNKFTSRFNKVNIYVKNIFNELTQLLSVVSETPSGTEGTPTVGQLKDMFETKYPALLSNTFVPKTTTINGNALSGNITICGVACACCGKNGNSYSAFGSNAFNSTAFTTCTGTVTKVKVGTTDYNPTNGVVSLPAYPSTLTYACCAGGVYASGAGTTVCVYPGLSDEYAALYSKINGISAGVSVCHACRASGIEYVSNAFCIYTAGSCYCLCNRCNGPAFLAPLITTCSCVLTCICQYKGFIINSGCKINIGYCTAGSINICVAGFMVY